MELNAINKVDSSMLPIINQRTKRKANLFLFKSTTPLFRT